jgi:pimeloyl-ACP methyl ester carboxylesterase
MESTPGTDGPPMKPATSELVHSDTLVDGVRLHSVKTGSGPAVDFIAGWPQWWWTWRHVMAALAPRFTVYALDLRGQGASDKPVSGYDTAAVAAEVEHWAQLNDLRRFVLVGHDVGAWVAFAYASSFPRRLAGLALLDALVPGLGAATAGLPDDAINKKQFQFSFNRLPDLPEMLIRGREREFIAWLVKHKSKYPDKIGEDVIDAMADALRDAETLRAGFEFYRALPASAAHTQGFTEQRLEMPVLTIGAGAGVGSALQEQLALRASDLEDATIEESGHYLSEETPNELIAGLRPFLDRALADDRLNMAGP